jgi:hypothetical protein
LIVPLTVTPLRKVTATSTVRWVLPIAVDVLSGA